MARQPEVFVRSLEPAEAQRLVKITRTARDRVRPARLRATFHRTAGVRQMFAAVDLASGQMFYRFRDR